MDLNDMAAMKLLPLLISVYVTIMIVFSHFRKTSLILKYAAKFSKKSLSPAECEYIKNSTLFWIGVSLTNVCLHLFFFYQSNAYYWIAYSSFGWYGVFGLGGILQYLHRKFIFLKRVQND
jgi:uncharacterized membrane protein